MKWLHLSAKLIFICFLTDVVNLAFKVTFTPSNGCTDLLS